MAGPASLFGSVAGKAEKKGRMGIGLSKRECAGGEKEKIHVWLLALGGEVPNPKNQGNQSPPFMGSFFFGCDLGNFLIK